MKILMLSDIHFRYTAPRGRIDDYYEEQFKKFGFLLRQDWDLMLQAGDFFHSPNPPLSLLNRLISLLNEYQDNREILVIPGQHDIYMRSKDMNRTAMGLLTILGYLTDINGFQQRYKYWKYLIHGKGFGSDFDIDTCKLDPDRINILVIHDMIGNEPLFPGHEITDAKQFLKSHNFDLILCGDYHYPFLEKSGMGKCILNTGCMMRMTRDERDMNRQPHAYIYDTDTSRFSLIRIPHKSADEVFTFSNTKVRNEMDLGLEQMVENLKRKGKVGISFMENLANYIKENDVNEDVVDLINEVLGRK